MYKVKYRIHEAARASYYIFLPSHAGVIMEPENIGDYIRGGKPTWETTSSFLLLLVGILSGHNIEYSEYLSSSRVL